MQDNPFLTFHSNHCFEGYYLLASIILAMSHCERLGREKISPYFSEKKWSVYGVTCIITIHALGSYATTAFFLRSYENVMENWRSHHFWGHIACLVFYLVVSLLPTPPKPIPTQKTVTPVLESPKKVTHGGEMATFITPEANEKASNIEFHKQVMKYS